MSLLKKRGVSVPGRARLPWLSRALLDMDRFREQVLGEALRAEEQRRVAEAFSYAADRRQARDVVGLVEAAVRVEREQCARLAETYGPNLMALHLANLIRQKV